MPAQINYKLYSNDGATLIAERLDGIALNYLYTPDGYTIYNCKTITASGSPVATLDYKIAGFSLTANATSPDSGGGIGELFSIDNGGDPNIAYVVPASNKTTLDLSTLSDISDGTHTVKVKAKADGYRNSEFSNEVSYTKAPAGYNLTTSNVEIPYENYAYFDITFGDGTKKTAQLGDSTSIGDQYSTNYPKVSNPIPNVIKIRLYTYKDYPSKPYIRMKTSGTVLDKRQQGGSIELELTTDTSALILNGSA